MDTHIKTTIEKITPETASQYLSSCSHPDNRNVDYKKREYVKIMRKGEWMLNGEPIVFDSNGVLQNGHTRLNAVVLSEVPVEFLIVRGVDPACFWTYDSGKNRTPGDVLQMAGFKNGRSLAAIISGTLIYRSALSVNNGQGGSLNRKLTRDELLFEADKNKDIYETAYRLSVCENKKPPVYSRITGTAYSLALLAGVPERVLLSFAAGLNTGDRLSKNHPANTLRKKALQHSPGEHSKTKAKLSSNYLTVATVYSLNAYLNCKELKIIRVQEEHNAIPIAWDGRESDPDRYFKELAVRELGYVVKN